MLYGLEKNTKNTDELDWSNSSLEKLVIDFQHQFYKRSRVQKSKVHFRSITELNWNQSMDRVWLKYSSIGFEWLGIKNHWTVQSFAVVNTWKKYLKSSVWVKRCKLKIKDGAY